MILLDCTNVGEGSHGSGLQREGENTSIPIRYVRGSCETRVPYCINKFHWLRDYPGDPPMTASDKVYFSSKTYKLKSNRKNL